MVRKTKWKAKNLSYKEEESVDVISYKSSTDQVRSENQACKYEKRGKEVVVQYSTTLKL